MDKHLFKNWGNKISFKLTGLGIWRQSFGTHHPINDCDYK